MTTPTCRICGQPVHRYSPDHPGTPDDLMGCVNSLRGALEEGGAEAKHLREALAVVSIDTTDGVEYCSWCNVYLPECRCARGVESRNALGRARP